jgi:hypothetical protein
MAVEPYFDKHGFLSLNNAAITINGEEGIQLMSIEVSDTSTTGLSVTGDPGMTMGGVACGTIVLPPGKAMTIGTGKSAIDNLILSAPADCTALIIGVKLVNVP